MLETWTLAVFGEMKSSLGYLPVGAAVGDQAQDVAFPAGEAEGLGTVGGGGRFGGRSGGAA